LVGEARLIATQPEMQISLSDSWRAEYRNERYLREASTDAVLQRVGHLMGSVLGLLGGGLIAPMISNGESLPMARLTHALEELQLRGVSYRDRRVFEAMQVPQPRTPRVLKALGAFGSRRWPAEILVKFGDPRYLEPLVREGRIRISPASSYDDPSLNPAQRDKECEVSAYVLPMDAHRLMAIQTTTDSSGRVVSQEGRDINVASMGSVQVQFMSNSDYYVYCVSRCLEARMFDDFNYDACVVFTEPSIFVERLRAATTKALPDWRMVASEVFYFDPYLSRVHQLEPFLCKHFRFAYQNEYRFAWIASPENPTIAKLSHIELVLGSLAECAELISL